MKSQYSPQQPAARGWSGRRNGLLQALGVLSGLVFAAPLGAQTAVDVMAEVRSDVANALAGIAVGISASPSGAQGGFITDPAGRTPVIQVASGDVVTVTIADSRTTDGSTIGQVIDFLPVTPAGADTYEHDLMYMTPVVRTMRFDSSDELTTDPNSLQWYAHPFGASYYDFEIGVGALRTAGTIEAYFRYHQSPVPGDYNQCILFRSDRDLDLGDAGVVLGINISEFGYPTLAADVFHVGSTAPSGTLNAEHLATDQGAVLFRLTGDFPAGDTLILLGASSAVRGGGQSIGADPQGVPPAGGGGGAYEPFAPASATARSRVAPMASLLVAAPVALPATPRAAASAVFTPCIPDPPGDETCNVPPGVQPPTPENDCGAEMVGPSLSGTEIHRAGGTPLCTPAGVSMTSSVCWEVSGAIGMSVAFSRDPVEVTVGANGRVSQLYCWDVTMDECTCVAAWLCDWYVSVPWRVCKRYLVWDNGLRYRMHYRREFTCARGVTPIPELTSCMPDVSGCP